MEKTKKQEQFEITKHYAGVLSMHFRWISCHTFSDGSAILYCERQGQESKRMTGVKVRQAGELIESGKSAEQEPKK